MRKKMKNVYAHHKINDRKLLRFLKVKPHTTHQSKLMKSHWKHHHLFCQCRMKSCKYHVSQDKKKVFYREWGFLHSGAKTNYTPVSGSELFTININSILFQILNLKTIQRYHYVMSKIRISGYKRVQFLSKTLV